MRIARIGLLTLIVIASGSAVARDLIVDATAQEMAGTDIGETADVAINTQTSDSPAYRNKHEARPSRDYYLPNYPHRISVCADDRGRARRC